MRKEFTLLDTNEIHNVLGGEEIVDLVDTHEPIQMAGPHQARLLPYIDSYKDDRVGELLDIGCGTGKSVWMLQDLLGAGNYVGVDASEKAIAIARGAFPDEEFHVANIYMLPRYFDQRKFRFFFAQGVLNYISRERMPEALIALRETTEPGGYGYITMRIGEEDETITSYRGHTLQHPITSRAWNEGTFRSLLTQVGFEIVSPVTCYDCGVLTDIVRKHS